MIKNSMIRLGITCIILMIAGGLSGVIILNTTYLTPFIQWALQETMLPSFHVAKVTYQFPFHLKLSQVKLEPDSAPINTIELWFNPYQTTYHQLVLDSVLVDGMNASDDNIRWPSIPHVHLNQFAAKNITYSMHNGLTIQGIDFQVNQPTWHNPAQIIPNGKLQAYAKKIIWRGETLSHLLLTGEYQPSNSVIQGLSFNWHQASLSIQAQEKDNHWTVTSLTAERLEVSQEQLHQLVNKFQDVALHSTLQVERLDILRSQLTSPHIKLINFDLSASDFLFDQQLHPIWNQSHASLSLNADSISLNKQQWIEPNINISFTPNTIHIEDFSASLLQGQVHFSGQLTPNTVHIQDLQLQGIKLFIESDTPTDWSWITTYFPMTTDIFIDQLKVKDSQIIQLAHKPYWQFSGINLDAENAQVVDQSKWGLWSGHLRASANSLSYDDVIASQGLIDMHSDAKTWYLDQLFVPFQNGYIKAQGEWDYGHKGAPWKFSLETDSMPLKLFKLPLHINGLADISMLAQGLSGDSVIVGQTLTGNAQIGIRDGVMQLNDKSQPFTLNPVIVNSDRGQINVPLTPLTEESLDATISGNWDFSQSADGKLILSVMEGKAQHQFDLLHSSSNQAVTIDKSVGKSVDK